MSEKIIPTRQEVLDMLTRKGGVWSLTEIAWDVFHVRHGHWYEGLSASKAVSFSATTKVLDALVSEGLVVTVSKDEVLRLWGYGGSRRRSPATQWCSRESYEAKVAEKAARANEDQQREAEEKATQTLIERHREEYDALVAEILG